MGRFITFNLIFFLVVPPLFADWTDKEVVVSKVGAQTNPDISAISGILKVILEDEKCLGTMGPHACLIQGGIEYVADDASASIDSPVIAEDSSGNLFVAWAEPRTGTKWDIYFRRKYYDTWSNSFKANTTSDQDACRDLHNITDQLFPSLAADGSTIFLAWQDYTQAGLVRICLAKSEDAGESFLPNKLIANGGFIPSIWAEGGRLHLVYSDSYGNLNYMYSDDGGENFSPVQEIIQVVSQGLQGLSAPDVSSKQNKVFIVYQDTVYQGAQREEYGQDIILLIQEEGIWYDPVVIKMPGDQKFPSISIDGGAWVVFEEDNDIYSIRLKGSLHIEGEEIGDIDVNAGDKDIEVMKLKISTLWDFLTIVDGVATMKTDYDRTESVLIKSFTIGVSEGVEKLKLWWDDGDGKFDEGDSMLDEGEPQNERVTFNINFGVSPGEEKVLFVSADINASTIPGTLITFRLDSTSAKGEWSGLDITPTEENVSGAVVKVVNRSPVAIASAEPESVAEGSGIVTLRSYSYDPDDEEGFFSDPITQCWEQTSGPEVEIPNLCSVEVSFQPPQVLKNTYLTFVLHVHDSFGASSTDYVQVLVANSMNEPPVAHAKVNVDGTLVDEAKVDEGSKVNLDGSLSYDPNGDPLIFFWTQVRGKKVDIENASSSQASFWAPSVTGGDEELIFMLTVTDSYGAQATDTVKVIVANTINDLPFVTFTIEPEISLAPATVLLDASGSYDPDGKIIAYVWNFGDETGRITDSPKTTHTYTLAGEYTVTLTVQDSRGGTASFSKTFLCVSEVGALKVSGESRYQTVFPGAVTVNVLKVSVKAEIEPIKLESFTIGATGPLEHIEKLVLVKDVDGDGEYSKSDEIIGVSTSLPTELDINVSIDKDASIDFLILINLSEESEGSEFIFSVNEIIGKGEATGKDVIAEGLPIISAALKVVEPSVTVSAIYLEAVSYQVPTTDEVILGFEILAEAQDVRLDELFLKFDGDTDNVESVLIFDDLNDNGTLDASDSILWSGGLESHVRIGQTLKKDIHHKIYVKVKMSGRVASASLLPLFLLGLIALRRRTFVLAIVLALALCAKGTGKGVRVEEEEVEVKKPAVYITLSAELIYATFSADVDFSLNASFPIEGRSITLFLKE